MVSMTNPVPAKNNKKRNIIIFSILGLVLVCCGAGVAGVAGMSKKVDNAITQVDNTTAAPAQQITVAPLDGKGNQLVALKDADGKAVVLNGAFKVEYTADPGGLIVNFIKADGSDGESWRDASINELNVDSNVAGSKIMHLTNVTQIQVDNVTGAWHIVLTPIAG